MSTDFSEDLVVVGVVLLVLVHGFKQLSDYLFIVHCAILPGSVGASHRTGRLYGALAATRLTLTCKVRPRCLKPSLAWAFISPPVAPRRVRSDRVVVSGSGQMRLRPSIAEVTPSRVRTINV